MDTLCKSCVNVREVVSGTGSTFLLCRLSQTDKRFPKYPPQPIIRCDGYGDKRGVMATFRLEVLSEKLAICRLDADAKLPDWATGTIVSITRTADELSIVCAQANVPENIRSEADWRCLRVDGPMDLALVGVIASLTHILAAANMSVFVVSTFDTDYLLVKESKLDAAIKSLIDAGHTVQAPARNSSRNE